jgi:hypothetical protein
MSKRKNKACVLIVKIDQTYIFSEGNNIKSAIKIVKTCWLKEKSTKS